MCFDDIAARLENGSECFCDIVELNKGLCEDGLYIASFVPTLPPYESRDRHYVIGSGDIYSDKDVTVNEKGFFKEISLGR